MWQPKLLEVLQVQLLLRTEATVEMIRSEGTSLAADNMRKKEDEEEKEE